MSMTSTPPQTHRLTLALSLAWLSLSVQAQTLTPATPTPPGIGDALRQVPPMLQTQPAAPLPALGRLPVEPPMQGLPGGAVQVLVEVLDVVGNREIDRETLLALVRPEQGKRMSLTELEALATRLTRHYRANGYFVARVYVPAQDVTAGRVTLRVVEGQYGQFHLTNRSLVRDETVQGLLDDIKHYDIVSLDTLERAMLIINDTPGVRVVRADVMPGQKVGTSDFAIGTEATPGREGHVLLDNHGSRYTGRGRLSGYYASNSPTGRGDRLSASGMVTQQGGLLNGRLAYSSLVATNGSRLEGALSQTRYALGDRYQALDASGTATGLELTWSTPVQRTRLRSVEGAVIAGAKQLRDDVASTSTVTRKRTASLTLQMSLRSEHDWLGAYGLTQTTASLSFGHLGFGDAVAATLDAAGSQTQGRYAKLNLSVARASVLPDQFTLTTSARAQATLDRKNLDGSERMGVSGPGSVAAYASGELSGDHAVLLRAELARPVSVAGLSGVSALVFADHGWARAAGAVPVVAARQLGDVGVGMNVNAAQGGVLKLALVRRITGGAPVSEPVGKSRLLLQGGWVF